MAICSNCSEAFDAPHRNSRYCPPCKVDITRRRKREFEEQKRRAAGIIAFGSVMQCGACGAECIKDNGQRLYCDPCSGEAKKIGHRAANRKYEAARPPRKRHPDETKERNRRYAEKHPERVLERSRRYNAANREAINAKARERNKTEKRRQYLRGWGAHKRATDPAFVLDARMTTAIKLALRGRKAGRSWEKLVGYSLDELRAHMERQFVRGMSWQNMGKWHIDHIVPRSSFSYTDADQPDFKACWSLTNLRPLWAVENWSKHAKRLFLI